MLEDTSEHSNTSLHVHELRSEDEENLQAVVAKLGAKPVRSFLLQIGYAYGSGLLVVELAYQCVVRWPCMVWAETYDVLEGESFVRVYAKEDMERLRAEKKTFTSTQWVDLDGE